MGAEEQRIYKREWQRRWRLRVGMEPRQPTQLALRLGRPMGLLPSEVAHRKKMRYSANRERLIAYQRAWMIANPDKVRVQRLLSRRERDARIRAGRQGRISYRRILKRDDGVCGICRAPILTGSLDEIHFDHIVPLSRGGLHVESNLQVAHSACNLHKHASLGP